MQIHNTVAPLEPGDPQWRFNRKYEKMWFISLESLLVKNIIFWKNPDPT
jgi:hypothetical protein